MNDFEDLLSVEAVQFWANNGVSPATLSQTTEPVPTGDNVAVIPAPQQPNHISDNHKWYLDPTHQPQQPTPVDDITGLDPFPQMKRKRKRRKSSEAIPGCLTIKSAEAQGPKTKRSKFQPGRREEVAKIRRIGACLRCRQLKIPVSSLVPHSLMLSRQHLGYISALRYGLAHPVAVANALATVERQSSDGWTQSRVPSMWLIYMPLV